MIILCDKSGLSIVTCFWNERADHFEALKNSGDPHIVIICKQIRVTEFGGISLNQHEDSRIEFNPQTKKALKLLRWYKNLGEGEKRDKSPYLTPIRVSMGLESDQSLVLAEKHREDITNLLYAVDYYQ